MAAWLVWQPRQALAVGELTQSVAFGTIVKAVSAAISDGSCPSATPVVRTVVASRSSGSGSS